MNFEYSADQQAFQESVIKFLQQEYDFEQRQKIQASDAAYSDSIWKTCAELGWLSLPFEEAVGGFGGSAVDTVLLFEELGKHLVLEPFMETLVQLGGVLQASQHPQRATYIEQLMSGELQGAFAHSEPYQNGFDNTLNTKATKLDNGYQLNGCKSVVYNAAAAELFVFSAELDGSKALFLVPAGTEALSQKGYTTVDGREAAELSLVNVLVAEDSLLATGAEAESILNRVLDNTLLAQVAEMVGAMQVLVDTTVEYTKERKQFGVPLSFFQVLQHKMVEMFMATELTRSLMYAAAIKLRDDSDDARAYVAAAKVKADKGAQLVAQFAVQLHGGIGTTDELKVGHYLKHIEVLTKQFGATRNHVSRYQKLR
ncbi:acyl-CoA dehydrogenase family protein [Maricurvus nonylphenolicus]|uniref:acyl-CoA dehydrogenase family protein n=1 Tax=Maricurvus nonylphenolicus TaxID=1008307 RepID=UPI0036F2DF1C